MEVNVNVPYYDITFRYTQSLSSV